MKLQSAAEDQPLLRAFATQPDTSADSTNMYPQKRHLRAAKRTSSAQPGHVLNSGVAAVGGERLDRTVSFRRITVSPGSDIPLGPQGSWDEDATPLLGTLPERETNALLDLLTPSAVCWFVLWDGWDGLRLDPRQVSVHWHGNPHLVYRGPIELIRRFEWSRRWQIPPLWFAEDRTWCVGSDIEVSAARWQRVRLEPGSLEGADLPGMALREPSALYDLVTSRSRYDAPLTLADVKEEA